MKKQTNSFRKEQINDATVNFIKNVCTRIIDAIEEVSNSFTKQPQEKNQQSSLGRSQGIGLFLFIKENQETLKNKFPAFSDNQIINILIAQWQNLSLDQKIKYCSKVNIDQLKGSKKLKKLEKIADKFEQSLHNQQKNNHQKKNQKINPKTQTKEVQKKDKNIHLLAEELHQIQQQEDCDQFFDEPNQKQHIPPPSPIQIHSEPSKSKFLNFSSQAIISICIQPQQQPKQEPNKIQNITQIIQAQEQITQKYNEKLPQQPNIQSQQVNNQNQSKQEGKKLQNLGQKQQGLVSDVSIMAVPSNNNQNQICSLQVNQNSIIDKQQNGQLSNSSSENNKNFPLSESNQELQFSLGIKSKDLSEAKLCDELASAQSNDLGQEQSPLNQKHEIQQETPFFHPVNQVQQHLQKENQS